MIEARCKISKKEFNEYRRKTSRTTYILMISMSVFLAGLGVLEIVMGETTLGIIAVVVGSTFTPLSFLVGMFVQKKYFAQNKMFDEGTYTDYAFGGTAVEVTPVKAGVKLGTKSIPYVDFAKVTETKLNIIIQTTKYANIVITKSGVKNEDLPRLIELLKNPFN